MKRTTIGAMLTTVAVLALPAMHPAPAAADEPPPITSYGVGPGFATNDIVTGPDGALWRAATTTAGRPGADLVRTDPATGAESVTDLAGVDGALALTFTSAGELWVLGDLAGGSTDRLYRVDPGDRTVLDQLEVPRAQGARGLAADADGHLWYVSDTAGEPLVRVEPGSDTVDRYAVPIGGDERGFGHLVLGPDGNLWVPVLLSSPGSPPVDDPDVLAVVTPDGDVTSVPITGQLNGVTASFGGRVWFGMRDGAAIGNLDPVSPDPETWPVAPAATVDAIAAGPDGRAWFADSVTSALGALDPGTGAVTVEPTPGARPALLADDGDDGLWFVDARRFLARVDSATGAFTPRSRSVDQPTLLLDGPDGRVWAASADGFEVGALDPAAGPPTDPPVESVHVGHPVSGLAVGPGDSVVFSAWDGHLGRIDPTTMTVETAPVPGVSDPSSVVLGPDGAVWATGFANDTLGEVDPGTGVVTVHPATGVDGPGALVDDGAGTLWFAGELNGTLGEVDPDTGAVEAHDTGTIDDPLDVAVAGDGAVWVIGRRDIARFDPADDSIVVHATGLDHQRQVAVGPDGNLWITAPRHVARVDVDTGAVTDFGALFATPTATAQGEWGITTAADGNLWVATNDLDLPWLHRLEVPEVTGGFEPHGFSDIGPGDAVDEPARWARHHGIVAAGDTFRPDAVLKRRLAVTWLHALFDRPTGSPPRRFADVPRTAPYKPALKWAWAQGAITDYPGNRFKPDVAMNRAQFVWMVWNALDRPDAGGHQHGFTDVAAGAWYGDALDWADAHGLAAAPGAGTFGPKLAVTRAEALIALHHIADQPELWDAYTGEPPSTVLF